MIQPKIIKIRPYYRRMCAQNHAMRPVMSLKQGQISKIACFGFDIIGTLTSAPVLFLTTYEHAMSCAFMTQYYDVFMPQ